MHHWTRTPAFQIIELSEQAGFRVEMIDTWGVTREMFDCHSSR